MNVVELRQEVVAAVAGILIVGDFLSAAVVFTIMVLLPLRRAPGSGLADVEARATLNRDIYGLGNWGGDFIELYQ